MNTDIPQSVIREAQGLIERYGQCIDYLGGCQDVDYFVFHFPDRTITGFPIVYLYYRKTEEVVAVTGFNALDIVEEFNKSKNN